MENKAKLWRFRFPADGENRYHHVTMIEEDGVMYCGAARLSKRDQYDRKKGWKISDGRARVEKDLVQTMHMNAQLAVRMSSIKARLAVVLGDQPATKLSAALTAKAFLDRVLKNH